MLKTIDSNMFQTKDPEKKTHRGYSSSECLDISGKNDEIKEEKKGLIDKQSNPTHRPIVSLGQSS